VRRREAIALLGGAAAAWPFAARPQPAERMRRLGVLMNFAEDDAQSQVRIAALQQGLDELGWTAGRNLKIDYRWGVGAADYNRRNAAELVALAPDVIVTSGNALTAALQQTTRAVPIVFASVFNPVGAGFVDSMARPGGNATGFTMFEYGMSGKWLELLKEIAPALTRAAVLRNPIVTSRSGQVAAIQDKAVSLRMELSRFSVRDADEIERAVTAFARAPHGGLIITGAPSLTTQRDLIVALAARHGLPAVYPYRLYAAGGGLVSYGPDVVVPFRRAAGYVDRILKGEKPADLPVQTPTKYELVINLKTARTLALEVPSALRARADALIE
jgi:putative tryptophan/tyrosine transport system substrate-binding protein